MMKKKQKQEKKLKQFLTRFICSFHFSINELLFQSWIFIIHKKKKIKNEIRHT